MRTPMPGILPPRAQVKVTPSPPIADHEKPVVVCPGRKRPPGEVAPVLATPVEGGAVVLENLKDSYAPYVLLIVERSAHEMAGKIYQAVRERSAANKKES